MDKIYIKTPEEVAIMAEGGLKLHRVKNELRKKVQVGVTAYEIDKLAEDLIVSEGAEPSFKKVPKYFWTTCVNVNDGVVHGIPTKEVVFKDGDLVSVDVGVFYKGFHTDTSFSVLVGKNAKLADFLHTGQSALDVALGVVKPGNYVFDISEAIEKTLKKQNLNPVKALVGHGVGRSLHEEPAIPCFAYGKRQNSVELREGMVLAVEIMYSDGTGEIVLENDGWTISTRDGKISALFEDTVSVTQNGHKVLT